jgi:hypothetical protein
MSIIIGSSNVYRFFRPERDAAGRKYVMVRCTDISSFRAIMTNLESDDKEVIVSVVENFLATAARDEKTEEGRFEALGESVKEYMRIIRESAVSRPNVKFALANPMKRPKFDWYQNNLDDIQLTLVEIVTRFRLDNITLFEAIPDGCQQFEEDQVHLTRASGDIFVEGLIKGAETFFDTELIQLNEMEVNSDTDLEILERRIAKLEGQVQARQNSDNIIFAKIREDLDAASNKTKEDRIIITGITSKTVPPVDPEGRKNWIRGIVTDIFESVIPGFTGKILYVNQMKMKNQQLPMVEVKLDSAGSAGSIRKAFAEKKKAGNDLGRTFISNSVNLATRVRVDILKALARKISDSNITAHTVPFVSRPVMHVRPTNQADSNQINKTYTFVDATAKFGHLLKQVELGEAYRRAGNSFKGQMEQQFIILRENQFSGSGSGARGAGTGSASGSRGSSGSSRPPGPPGGARKRPREDDEVQHLGGGSERGRGRGRWQGHKGYRK